MKTDSELPGGRALAPEAGEDAPAAARRPVPPGARPRAPELVANRIRDLIVAGTLKSGEQLPPEARLMAEYGVSRPTIREAFRVLESDRLVTVSRGARGGAVVHAPDPLRIAAYALMVLRAERTTVAEVFSARRLFEPAVAREVALTSPTQAARVLRRALEEERALVDDVERFAVAITRFHRVLVDLSGNRPLIHLVSAIQSVVEAHQAMVIASQQRLNDRDAMRAMAEPAFRSHRKLIDLIARGDADGAQDHWRRHMDTTTATWLAGYETLTIHELLQDT